jgi:multidrug efflux pump subunit AcrB
MSPMEAALRGSREITFTIIMMTTMAAIMGTLPRMHAARSWEPSAGPGLYR